MLVLSILLSRCCVQSIILFERKNEVLGVVTRKSNNLNITKLAVKSVYRYNNTNQEIKIESNEEVKEMQCM